MRPKSGWTVRVGRYMPGYGLMIADHTTNIRGGLFWPQGAESENLEIGYMDRAGEILATYLQRRDGSEAIIGRASKFVGSSSQLGLSVFSSDDAKSAGLFAMIGFSKSFWAMAEVDYKLAEKPLIVEFEQIGVEILSGIMALGTRQATYFPHDENIYKHGFGLQIFPFPHFEFLTAVDRTIEGDQKTTTCSLLSHYYL